MDIRIDHKKISYYSLSIIASFIISVCAHSAERFNPAFLDNSPEAVADLSRFEDDEGQTPGTYMVEVFLNGEYTKTQNINFVQRKDQKSTIDTDTIASSDKVDETNLEPCFTEELLNRLNINIKKYFPDEKKNIPQCVLLSEYIPHSETHFDFDKQKLNISIPQIALLNSARGYISPEEWDEGISALLLDYSFTGSNARDTGNGYKSSNYYLNLNSGINVGPWRLRNVSAVTHNRGSGESNTEWNNINTYLQRSIIPFKSALVIGDTSTSGEIFDSLGIRGLLLHSDDNMLPDSLRGFAPTIRGVAESNAMVTIRQNGYIIYQVYVAPGAFDINDLYPTSNSGDLQVSVTESDGRVRQFTVPYSSVPILQREGQIKYTFATGQYRSGNPLKRKPEFTQGTISLGLPRGITVYGGSQLSTNYKSLSIGSGMNLGAWGAVSGDITHANSTLADNSRYLGQSLRFLYAKSLNDYGTRFQLLGYRYSTVGFYTLAETTYKDMRGYWFENSSTSEHDNENNPVLVDSYNLNYTKKNKIQINLNQKVGNVGSLYLIGSRQNYWGTNESMDYIMAGFNSSWKKIFYNVSISVNKNPWVSATDKNIAFSVSIPLANFMGHSDNGSDITRSGANSAFATYSATRNNDGKLAQQAGLSGTLLDDNNLNYSITQGYANQSTGNSGSATLNWQSGYGQTNAGYNYSKGYQQVNYGLRGGIVAHQYGVTLSQPLGNTNVLIKAPDANHVKVENATGITTDWRGYAVVPYASTYHVNRIALDTKTLKENIEIDGSVINVVPTEGALVLAEFKTNVGARVMLTLKKQNGKYVPFGAIVSTDDDESNGIVGDGGQVYLSGLSPTGKIKVSWGQTTSDQCNIPYKLPVGSENKTINHMALTCL